jgi:hypothetical protein
MQGILVKLPLIMELIPKHLKNLGKVMEYL